MVSQFITTQSNFMARKKEEDLTPNKQVELVTMYGTDKSPFHAPGEETQVHPDMVDHFRARGLTTEEPDEEDGEDEGVGTKE